MAFDLPSGVVQVLKGTSIVGTGFIISDLGLIATCVHVLEEARVGPGEDVTVQFQAGKERRQAQVMKCSSKEEDVAILKVNGGLPPDARLLVLGTSKGVRKAKSFGFPLPGETWSDVDVVGEGTIFGEKRRLQLRSKEITRGFSGAPLCDEPSGFVIGMVAEILRPDEYGRLDETAYAVPSEILHDICPEIKLEQTPISPTPHPQPIQLWNVPFQRNRNFEGREDVLAITSPEDGSLVFQRSLVEGNSSAISGVNVYVLVWPLEANGPWWVQPTRTNPDGSWESEAYFGRPRDSGKNFKIIAIVTNQTLREGETFIDLPPHFATSDEIGVKRR